MPRSPDHDDWLRAWLRKHGPGRRPNDRAGPGKPPIRATSAPPGSPAKIEVMEGRALRGEALFHPDDARGGDRPGLWLEMDTDDYLIDEETG
jgi:hypothetical protein